jgi:hypothetical protein
MVVGSMPCRFEHFSSDWYKKWTGLLGYPPADRPAHAIRKWWEYAAIAQALDERGLLKSGSRGIGFAVGREPLASLFAATGASIVATDLHPELSDAQWTATGQHAAARDDIWAGETICAKSDFDRLVEFRAMDMNALPPGDASFDFAWSSCAFEHLGSLAQGLAFVKSAMSYLRPGGVAVHTTEFNVCSNSDTVTTGGAVIYRRQDLEELERSLRPLRCGMAWPDFDPGHHEYDICYDEPPFFTKGLPHVKLLQDGFVCTSYVITIKAF